jgi:FkbM family methyltransferase
MMRLGTDYGGWVIPKNVELDENSVVYLGGVGEDISFDLLLQDKYNSQLFLIDPTIRAINHFKEIQEYYKDKKINFSGDIQPDYFHHISKLSPNFSNIKYIEKGLYKEKSKLKFYKQNNPRYVSQSLVDNMFGNEYDEVEVDSIKNIMEEYKHKKIDLLKLDIEGSEIDVVNQMLDDNIYPKYLCIEFDLYLKNKDKEGLTKELVERLIGVGYKVIHNENMNITFML